MRQNVNNFIQVRHFFIILRYELFFLLLLATNLMKGGAYG
jgi:hypothetical protein